MVGLPFTSSNFDPRVYEMYGDTGGAAGALTAHSLDAASLGFSSWVRSALGADLGR